MKIALLTLMLISGTALASQPPNASPSALAKQTMKEAAAELSDLHRVVSDKNGGAWNQDLLPRVQNTQDILEVFGNSLTSKLYGVCGSTATDILAAGNAYFLHYDSNSYFKFNDAAELDLKECRCTIDHAPPIDKWNRFWEDQDYMAAAYKGTGDTTVLTFMNGCFPKHN